MWPRRDARIAFDLQACIPQYRAAGHLGGDPSEGLHPLGEGRIGESQQASQRSPNSGPSCQWPTVSATGVRGTGAVTAVGLATRSPSCCCALSSQGLCRCCVPLLRGWCQRPIPRLMGDLHVPTRQTLLYLLSGQRLHHRQTRKAARAHHSLKRARMVSMYQSSATRSSRKKPANTIRERGNFQERTPSREL